jgi:AbiV family abortive infection protein
VDPTDGQLAEWALAALSNARRLYSDAVLLFDADRTASAMVLLGLATDEIGKHMMITAFPIRGASEPERKKFERRVRSHVEKVGNPLLMDWMLDPDAIGDPPDPAEFHRLRNSAIYSDLTVDGVTVPEKQVDRSRVAKNLAAMGRFLRYCEALTRGVDTAKLAATMKRGRTAPPTNEERSSLWKRANLVASVNGVPEPEAARFATIVEAVMTEPAHPDFHREI